MGIVLFGFPPNARGAVGTGGLPEACSNLALYNTLIRMEGRRLRRRRRQEPWTTCAMP